MSVRARSPHSPPTPESGHPDAEPEAVVAAHGLYRLGLAYGRLIHRLRWIILALWVAGLITSVPFAGSLGSVLKGGGYSFRGSESARVQTALTDTLHQPRSQTLVVFQSSYATPSDPDYQNEIDGFVSRVAGFPHLMSTQVEAPGRDGRTAVVALGFDSDASTTQHSLPELRRLLPSGAAAGPARAYLGGDAATSADYSSILQHDIQRAEMVSLPIALVVLLIVFGSLVAATMPLVLALVAVPAALGLIYAIAVHSDTTIFVENVATIVGLGISIDYSLFMTRRFRDELAHGRSVREAVAWTVATTGEAILFSGLTVMIGFAGLLLIGLPFMTSFGIGGAVVVGVAVLAALTLLPALLGVLGPRLDALHLPGRGRLSQGAAAQDARGERRGFWLIWALAVMRRPVLVIVGVAALLIGLGWPIFQMNVSAYGSSALPSSAPAQQALAIVQAQFPGTTGAPIAVLAQTSDGSSMLTPDHLERLAGLTRWLGTQPHVTSVVGLTQLPAASSAAGASAAGASGQLSQEQLIALYSTGAYRRYPALARLVASTTAGGTTLITVQSDTQLDSAAGKALIATLRAGDVGAADGLRVAVGGTQASSVDFVGYLYGNFPRAILFILVATYILLLLMFRSVVLPLKAVLMNVLSLGAAYGVLVFVFQWGHFHQLLGFTSDGFLDATIPILIFCILFGLSMDYEVFLLSRVREEWLRTQNNRYAVARGLEKTGGVITNAAVLFVIVTGSFTFTTLLMTKEIGLGMTVAILVDATIIRTLLVPATMRLLGRWNWWLPGRPAPVEHEG